MAYKPLLTIKNYSAFYPDKTVFERLSFSVGRGETVALVGANGSGKSTLFDIVFHRACDSMSVLADRELQTTGELHLVTDASVAYLGQQNEEPVRKSEQLIGGRGDGSRDMWIAFALDEDVAAGRPGSDGELRKRGIIETLSSGADLLLFDEPTNYLDMAGILAFEDALLGGCNDDCAVLLVSHDRRLLDRVADRTVYLSPQGVFETKGGFSAVRALVSSDVEARHHRAGTIRAQIGKLQQEMTTRMTWAARKEKSKRGAGSAKPHIAKQAAKQARRAKSAQLKAEKEIARLNETKPFVPKRQKLILPEYEVRNRQVIFLKDLSYRLPSEIASGDGRELFREVDLTVSTRDRVCVMGTNGSGKTTLLRILCREIESTSGEFRFNDGVKLRCLPQGLAGFFESSNLLDNFTDLEMSQTEARRVLGAALLRGDRVHGPLTQFSQGELVRAAVVRCILEQADFLILDEPTSHLDIETVEALEGLLESFPGGFLIVSHDREFVENVADRLYFLEDARLRLV
ncbi:MAG: ATP-binding cassette domain-containing protein [candidate division Zixibacteria bacterium]|nr:ATP-binding cassette domain-containing protein [candidate division Zixibacteria bacterium]